jgi:hypothetical protein
MCEVTPNGTHSCAFFFFIYRQLKNKTIGRSYYAEDPGTPGDNTGIEKGKGNEGTELRTTQIN